MNMIEKYLMHKGLTAARHLFDPSNSEFWAGIVAPIGAFAASHAPTWVFGLFGLADAQALQAKVTALLTSGIVYAGWRVVSKYAKA